MTTAAAFTFPSIHLKKTILFSSNSELNVKLSKRNSQNKHYESSYLQTKAIEVERLKQSGKIRAVYLLANYLTF